MPFKSKAQRRKFAELLVKGEITPEAYERWNKETGGRELPERVKRKRKGQTAKSKRRVTRKTGTRARRKKTAAKRRSK
jgi:hypothetical protein